MKTPEYEERDVRALDEAGGYYSRHVAAMTSERLHDKSAIAAELARVPRTMPILFSPTRR